jgi:hypothetical protein
MDFLLAATVSPMVAWGTGLILLRLIGVRR